MANKVYTIEETTITFGGAVGEDVAWSIEGVVNNAGRQSALHDFGVRTIARSSRFKYRLKTQFQATPTLGNSLDLYLKTSDGSSPDNDDGTGDAAVSAIDKLKNLHFLSSLLVDEAAANIVTVVSGARFNLDQRHVAIVGWNTSGATIHAQDSNSQFSLTPQPDEVQ